MINSTHNEKFVVTEKFIRTLKNKIYKYMASISKNVYTEKLDNIVNGYNNTYHRTTKIKHFDIKSSKHIVFKVENSDKRFFKDNLKYMIIWEYHNMENIFGKGSDLNWFQEVLKNSKILLRSHV